MSGNAVESSGSFLNGLRVIEIADELGEYCGKVLAGLGADVIKVEPPGGEKTRGYGPFYNDEPHPNRSLHFWHYNFGKRGIVLDLESEEDRQHFMRLAETADIVLDTRPRNYLNDRGIGYDAMRARNPSLIYARISPFGDDGPWADYEASDLVHLALGGVMMNCGYDPDPSGFYETPPIAPQAWQSYQIVGEVTAVQIIAALVISAEVRARTASVDLGPRRCVEEHRDRPTGLGLLPPAALPADLPALAAVGQPHDAGHGRRVRAASRSLPNQGRAVGACLSHLLLGGCRIVRRHGARAAKVRRRGRPGRREIQGRSPCAEARHELPHRNACGTACRPAPL